MNHSPVAVLAVPASAPAVPPQTERVIAALLGNPTLAATAEALGVNASTLWRVMRHPGFQREYREARRHIVSQAIAQVQQATGQAVETLRGVIAQADAPVWARIFASKAVLELAFKAVEFEDMDIRLSAIEAALKDLAEDQGEEDHAGQETP
jgi:DNA-binding MurR/RpiR family transcriptional regulator